MSIRKIRVALIQSNASKDTKENLKNALFNIIQAKKKGAEIVCLQELFMTRYFPQREESINFNLSEPIPGETSKALCMSARKNKLIIIGSIFEKRVEGLYHNTAIVIDSEGNIIHKYRKMHIPDDPRFYEKYYFAPGDSGFKIAKTKLTNIGVLVCWDQWYPEAARIEALEGAEILFYPTAIGWYKKEPQEIAELQSEAWEVVQRSHAITNGVYVAVANRVGQEDDLIFWGSSFIANPTGKIIAKASRNQEEILIADCDLDIIREQRHGWPFLRDRRIDAYSPLTLRFIDSSR